MPYATAQDSELSLATRWHGGDRQAGCVLIARYFDTAVAELASYGLGASVRAGEVFARVEASLDQLGPDTRFAALVIAHARSVARESGRGRGSGPLTDTVDLTSLR